MIKTNLTIGIEEEFQSVDSQTGELRSSIYTLLEKGRSFFGERLKGELVQSMLEVTTGICPDISVAREELFTNRALLAQLMQEEGLSLVSAGAHPISSWNEQEITNQERYIELEKEYRDKIRDRVLFGLHVHIGIESRELAIKLINQLRTWLPHLLALSANSPFWLGRFTRIKSYRQAVWKGVVPRSGLPDIFPTIDDYNAYINHLLATRKISSIKDIWWDIRPHSVYSTIEFRICDMPATIEDSVALAALCQALVAKLLHLNGLNESLPILPRSLIEENVWCAARDGLDATFADFTTNRSMNMREAIRDLLAFVEDVADSLGSYREMKYLRALLDDPRGNGADRQIAVYQESGEDVREVVRFLMVQTMQGIARPATQGEACPGEFRAALKSTV